MFYGFGCEGNENQRKKQATRLVTVWLAKQNKQLLISINKHFPARFAKRYKERDPPHGGVSLLHFILYRADITITFVIGNSSECHIARIQAEAMITVFIWINSAAAEFSHS